MKQIINYIWLLPLNLLGLLYRDILTLQDKCLILLLNKDCDIYVKDSLGCVTLGRYIFLSPYAKEDSIKHEFGHVIQSSILGPLYLIIVGLPSIIWALLHSNTKLSNIDYYSIYPENWANKLSDKYERK